MEDKTVNIPYYVAEGMVERVSRTNKKLWVMCMLLILLLVGTNALWLYYESQWEVIETEITQENEHGYNNYIGNNGDIYNGETNDKNTK